jgi:hypothetical protein
MRVDHSGTERGYPTDLQLKFQHDPSCMIKQAYLRFMSFQCSTSQCDVRVARIRGRPCFWYWSWRTPGRVVPRGVHKNMETSL